MLSGGYTFEKYPVALQYQEGDDIKMGRVAKDARALHARSHGTG